MDQVIKCDSGGESKICVVRCAKKCLPFGNTSLKLSNFLLVKTKFLGVLLKAKAKNQRIFLILISKKLLGLPFFYPEKFYFFVEEVVSIQFR